MSEITLTVRKAGNGLPSSVPRKYSLSQQQPLYLQADKDTVFQLADENGRLPEDVLFSREGEDLLIHPAVQDKAAAVIKDYYVYQSSPPQALYLPQKSLPAADYPQPVETSSFTPTSDAKTADAVFLSMPSKGGAALFAGLSAAALGAAVRKGDRGTPENEQPAATNRPSEKPVEQPKPAEQSKPVEQPKPVEKPSEKPVEQPNQV